MQLHSRLVVDFSYYFVIQNGYYSFLQTELNFKDGVWIQDTRIGFTFCMGNNVRGEAVSRTEEFSV